MRNSLRGGFTLVELVISVSFLAGMLLVAGLATERTLASFRERRAEQESVVEANRILQRVASELSFAAEAGLGPATLDAVGSERIEYRVALGGGAYSDTRTLALGFEPGELDNGLDDDGDGLVDEQRLESVEDEGGAAELRVTLANGIAEFLAGELPNGLDDNDNGLVDERGLSFVREGGALRVRLTVLYRTTLQTVRPRTLETLVLPRN
jgi:type II secretory pathway pseudopilin PulG